MMATCENMNGTEGEQAAEKPKHTKQDKTPACSAPNENQLQTKTSFKTQKPQNEEAEKPKL